ncbi:hypothetical protein P153DRAFT_295218 [Dothidotthia symphoricarpi CBS 119687]|uniref:Uncharacterized protein n=1 Tax=Dothidotthia symphoricarpi CBS 119687 TaxID=1392245 RepID=A0A6A6A9H4_9PLEO|nr:uncharacterized protein P153DRAFT_295218 [Dothidotthia symphoricarpi CBS 119687]KAF2127487.1 hypothetical protein P153DRAFT_295218 [Dothidotthia symphoricarpi CBS 119687]
MSDAAPEHALLRYRYEALFGVWLVVTGTTFLRIARQPYSSRLKLEQYESIFKGTSLSAVLLGIGIAPDKGLGVPACSHVIDSSASIVLFSRCTAQVFIHLASRSAKFKMWNPLYAFAPLVLVVVSIPLAIFAMATTSIAVSLLSLRAMAVYIQLGTAVVGAWLQPPSTKQTSFLYRSSPPSPERASPPRQRTRRSSSVSIVSSLDSAALASHTPRPAKKNGSSAALVGGSELTRDFEGVGGWRVPGGEDEEALWMGINSRLRLPADSLNRRHQRSHTGSASPSHRWTWSPEAFRMSPVQSRARTPVRIAAEDGGDYFPPQPYSSLRPLSSASEPVKQHHRRKSGSGSSSSSVGLMMAVKEVGE